MASLDRLCPQRLIHGPGPCFGHLCEHPRHSGAAGTHFPGWRPCPCFWS
jgi:hypothetical protein